MKSTAGMQHTRPQDNFNVKKCNENHFETIPYHAKFEYNR